MNKPFFFKIEVLLFLVGLFLFAHGDQSIELTTLGLSHSGSIKQLKTSNSILVDITQDSFSLYKYNSSITYFDPILKYLKHVELTCSHSKNQDMFESQMVLQRLSQGNVAALFAQFRLPKSSPTAPKKLPSGFKEPILNLITSIVNDSAISDIPDLDSCAWVASERTSNLVGIYCSWPSHSCNWIPSTKQEYRKESNVSIGDIFDKQWKIVPKEGVQTDKIAVSPVRLRLALEKLDEAPTLWKYDENSKNNDNYKAEDNWSIWNMIYEQEAILIGPTKTAPPPSEDVDIDSESAPKINPFAYSFGPGYDSVSIVSFPRTLKVLPASIQRTLGKAGMHREIITVTSHKSVPPPTTRITCRIFAIEALSEDIFVDQYEVEENARFGGPETTIYRDIDLEKPSYLSTQNIIVVSKVVGWDSVGSNLSLPIHLRYQRPTQSTPLIDVTIRPPIIGTLCSKNVKYAPPVNSTVVASLLMGKMPRMLPGQTLYIHHSKDVSTLMTQWPTGLRDDEDFVKQVTFAATGIVSVITIGIIWLKRNRQ